MKKLRDVFLRDLQSAAMNVERSEREGGKPWRPWHGAIALGAFLAVGVACRMFIAGLADVPAPVRTLADLVFSFLIAVCVVGLVVFLLMVLPVWHFRRNGTPSPAAASADVGPVTERDPLLALIGSIIADGGGELHVPATAVVASIEGVQAMSEVIRDIFSLAADAGFNVAFTRDGAGGATFRFTQPEEAA